MDYTAILSRLEDLLTGTTGILLIAVLGVICIVGAHVYRMRFGRTRLGEKSKSYRNVVIEPYEEEEGKDPIDAMLPRFSGNHQ